MEKIWLNSYPKQVPADINPDQYHSLVELFSSICSIHKKKPALENQGTVITYETWYAKSRDFAAYLQQKLHLKKGERFAIMLPNTLQYPIVLFGALMAGLSVVNVNPLYTPHELTHLLNDAGVETLIVLSNFAHTVEQVIPETQLKHVIVTELGDLFPFPKSMLINFVVKHVKHLVPHWYFPMPALSFKAVMHEGKSLPFNAVALNNSDIAFLQYTGGTTGIPKAAVLSHRNLLANIEQARVWISSVLREGEEVVITALPLYHIFSLVANLFVFLREAGKNVLITNPRDISGFIKTLRKHPFTVITGVNTLFNALLKHPNFAKLNFKHLRVALSGGMATQSAIAERWYEVTGKVLVEAYGLTETSPAVTANPLTIAQYNGTVGLPLPSTDVKICNDDDELPVGAIGELYVKGPQVMQGYWNNPEETARVMTKDGWLKTGDIATINNAGFIRIVDRKKDMIIVSGFNVYPNEVEDVIAAHPGVSEVAVVGRPDAQTGEGVHAYVVKKNPSLTVEALITYCHENLTGYKVPTHIEFRDSLPKSNVGKILRRAIS